MPSSSLLASTDQKRDFEVVVERDVEHDVERGAPPLLGQAHQRSVGELGVGLRVATEMLAQLTGIAPRPLVLPRLLPPRRDRGRPPAAPLSTSPSTRRTIGRMFSVKGSERFIWKTNGRQETCGQPLSPSAQAASWSAITFS